MAKRLTMLSTGSTSSIGTGVAAGVQFEQPAQRRQLLALIVDEPRVFLEDRVLPAARRVLQLEDRLRREEVVLAVAAPLVFAARLEIRRLRPDAAGYARRCRPRLPRRSPRCRRPRSATRSRRSDWSTNGRSRPTASKICAPQ